MRYDSNRANGFPCRGCPINCRRETRGSRRRRARLGAGPQDCFAWSWTWWRTLAERLDSRAADVRTLSLQCGNDSETICRNALSLARRGRNPISSSRTRTPRRRSSRSRQRKVAEREIDAAATAHAPPWNASTRRSRPREGFRSAARSERNEPPVEESLPNRRRGL